MNANDNLISHNDSFEFTHRNLETANSGNKNGGPTSSNAKSTQSSDSNAVKKTDSTQTNANKN